MTPLPEHVKVMLIEIGAELRAAGVPLPVRVVWRLNKVVISVETEIDYRRGGLNWKI
jgi:hypothetical protein